MRKFTTQHAQEVYRALQREECSATKGAELANQFERLNGQFSSSDCSCVLCALRRRHGRGGVQNGRTRFVVNSTTTNRRLGLCDYHLAQHLLHEQLQRRGY